MKALHCSESEQARASIPLLFLHHHERVNFYNCCLFGAPVRSFTNIRTVFSQFSITPRVLNTEIIYTASNLNSFQFNFGAISTEKEEIPMGSINSIGYCFNLYFRSFENWWQQLNDHFSVVGAEWIPDTNANVLHICRIYNSIGEWNLFRMGAVFIHSDRTVFESERKYQQGIVTIFHKNWILCIKI